MSFITLGNRDWVSISNLGNASLRQQAQKINTENNGFLSPAEQKTFFEQVTGKPAPVVLNPDSVYAIAGSKVRDDDALHVDPKGDVDDPGGAQIGNFHLDGFGAGHLEARRSDNFMLTPDGATSPDEVFQVTANCDLVDMKNMANIQDAKLIIGREQYYPPANPPTTGNFSPVSEAKLAIPMDIVGEDARPNEFGGMDPERKYLIASFSSETAKGIAGANGLVMYIQLTMKDGSVKYINKDGVAGKNFEVPSYVMRDT